MKLGKVVGTHNVKKIDTIQKILNGLEKIYTLVLLKFATKVWL